MAQNSEFQNLFDQYAQRIGLTEKVVDGRPVYLINGQEVSARRAYLKLTDIQRAESLREAKENDERVRRLKDQEMVDAFGEEGLVSLATVREIITHLH